MAIREILEVPDPRLKTVSTPVERFDGELKTLVADMFETMYAASGIGLAAIQVGVPLRVLVIDLQPEDPDAVWQGTYHEKGAELYPEWDHGRQHYRKNWCVMREKTVAPVYDDFYRETLAHAPTLS